MLLHAIAFAPKESLGGGFLETSRDAFRIAHDISAYSFLALARGAAPLMTGGGAMMCMSYYGAEKVIPNYNVMGVAKASLEATTRYLAWDLGKRNITVNAISAGPMKTLAAKGVSDFNDMIRTYEAHAPLGRSCTQEDLGATAVFLASGGKAISGQTIYVDGGYEIMGMY
jgi:enoyl-[acyl-carrier protein] reductase I